MVTAGHCFAVGANATTTDGNLSVGNVTQRGPFLPWPLQSFDMELIAGASYGSSIFVGGTNSSTGKHVNGAGDPVVGFTQYCRSGQTSGEQCGQTVQSVNAQVCTQTGCKSPVISYTGPVSQPGDSGAPFYVYSADSTQRVHPRPERRQRRVDELRGEVEPHLVEPRGLDRHLRLLSGAGQVRRSCARTSSPPSYSTAICS